MNWLQWVAELGDQQIAPKKKPRDPLAQLIALLKFHDVDLVLDVGANVGQFGLMLRRYGYKGRILSFEPLTEAWQGLTGAAESDPLWDVAPPCALGAKSGRVIMEHSAESDMSSILPQSPILQKISPTSAISAKVEVEMQRLDEFDIGAFKNAHLKLDVQGFEPEVLKGAGGLFSRISTVQLEMALLPVYEGEIPWQEMTRLMEKLGYEMHLVIPGYFERKLARQLQMDGIFARIRQ